MKLFHKLMINLNASNLNNIPLNELSSECVEYALKKGFSYKDAIDDRYEQYEEYIIFNINYYNEYIEMIINNNPECLDNPKIVNAIINKIRRLKKYELLSEIIDKRSSFIDNQEVKESIMDMINNYDGIKLLLMIIKKTKDLYFLNNYKKFDSLNDSEKMELYELLSKTFDYSSLPQSLIANNKELGMMFLNEDVKNVSVFLQNNKDNYDVDEIANLISNNLDDNTFLVLLDYLKKHDVSNEIYEKIVKNKGIDFEKICILYNDFNNIRTGNCLSIIKKRFETKEFEINSINDSNINLICDFINDINLYICISVYFNDNELLNQLINYMQKNNIVVSNNILSLFINNNYLITKDSPDFLKSNIDLAIIGLKNGSITLKELNVNNFVNCPVEQLIELVNVGILNESDSEVLEAYKKAIYDRFNGRFIRNDNSEYIIDINKINDDSYYDHIVSSIPDDVQIVYLVGPKSRGALDKDCINGFEIDKINKLIEAIKKSKRDIKINAGNLDIMDDNLLSRIVDQNMVLFSSYNRVTTNSAMEVQKLNKTLRLFVEDIKNSDLSDYEKYIAVYNIVKSYKAYKESPDEYDQSRNIYLIMQNDYMVCVGYADLLNKLLELVGITSITFSNLTHRFNYVKINDEKYGINGIFRCDATGNEETIEDPIDNSYYNLNVDLHQNYNSLLNELIRSDDDFIDSLDQGKLDQLYVGVIGLYSDLSNYNYDKKTALRIFKERYRQQKEKEIDLNKTIDAIISVKEHIAGRSFNGEERRKQKNYLIINNGWNADVKMEGYEDDLLLFESKLLSMKFGEYKKVNDPYEKVCFAKILDRMTEEYNGRDNDNISVRIYSDKIYMIFRDKTQEQLLQIEDYFNGQDVEITKRSKSHLSVDISNILKDEIIGNGLFSKISEIKQNALSSKSL